LSAVDEMIRRYVEVIELQNKQMKLIERIFERIEKLEKRVREKALSP